MPEKYAVVLDQETHAAVKAAAAADGRTVKAFVTRAVRHWIAIGGQAPVPQLTPAQTIVRIARDGGGQYPFVAPAPHTGTPPPWADPVVCEATVVNAATPA